MPRTAPLVPLRLPRLVFVALVAFATVPLAGAQDWPAFRGAKGDGRARVATAPATRWDAKTNVKWRIPLRRPANGSPIVVKGRVFLTLAEDADGKQRSLYCFDAKTGNQRWVQTVSIDRKMPTHKTNPYGGSTPVSDGERVVVWHGTAGLHCYTLDGAPLWKRGLGEFKHVWGYGTSPVIHDGTVILHCGPGERVIVLAIDLATGMARWKHEEPTSGNGEKNADGKLMGSWSTPVLVADDKRTLAICPLPTRVVALDVANGKVVWHCAGLVSKRGDLAYSSPSVGDGICMIKGGFEGPEFAIRLGGEGDVTESHRLWYHAERPSNTGSGVIVDGHLYIPDMRGTIACVNLETGDRVWSARAPRGQIWSSIVEAGGRLFLMNQRAATVVFEPNAKAYTEIARNILDEETNATPAITPDGIFLRTHAHLYCIAGDDTPPPAPADESPSAPKSAPKR